MPKLRVLAALRGVPESGSESVPGRIMNYPVTPVKSGLPDFTTFGSTEIQKILDIRNLDSRLQTHIKLQDVHYQTFVHYYSMPSMAFSTYCTVSSPARGLGRVEKAGQVGWLVTKAFICRRREPPQQVVLESFIAAWHCQCIGRCTVDALARPCTSPLFCRSSVTFDQTII